MSEVLRIIDPRLKSFKESCQLDFDRQFVQTLGKQIGIHDGQLVLAANLEFVSMSPLLAHLFNAEVVSHDASMDAILESVGALHSFGLHDQVRYIDLSNQPISGWNEFDHILVARAGLQEFEDSLTDLPRLLTGSGTFTFIDFSFARFESARKSQARFDPIEDSAFHREDERLFTSAGITRIERFDISRELLTPKMTVHYGMTHGIKMK